MCGVVVAVGGHFHQVEGFALGRILEFGDVEDDDVSQFLLRGEHGQDLSDLAAADERDFLSHMGVSFEMEGCSLYVKRLPVAPGTS